MGINRFVLWLMLSATVSASHAAGVGEAARASEPTAPDVVQTLETIKDVQIMPMSGRPLGVDEGPRISVSDIQIEGFKEMPDTEITFEQLKEVVEAEKVERGSVFTIGQLQELADKISKLYRSKGVILAVAYVPEQEVKDGVVKISILEGVLGNVAFESNTIYKEQTLMLPFDGMKGQPVTKQAVERALFTLSDYPGTSVFGMFRPGAEVGETELLVKVEQEKPYVFGVGADNHGSTQTGEYRGYADFTWNTPTGMGDRFYLQLQHSAAPALALFGEADYRFPKLLSGLDFGFRASRNDFDVDGDFEQSGIVEDAGAYGSWTIIRGRDLNLYANFDLTKRTYTAEGVLYNVEDRLAVGGIEFRLDHTDDWLGGLKGESAKGITHAGIRYAHGFPDILDAMESENDPDSSRMGRDGIRAGSLFDKLQFDILRYQTIAPYHSLLFRLEGQYSDDMLVAIEQMSIGGPRSVRAFPSSYYLADSGIYASLEYLWGAPGFSDKEASFGETLNNILKLSGHKWGDILKISAFVDYGYGEKNNSLPSEVENIELIGAGLGLRLTIPDRLQLGMSVSKPISEPDDEEDMSAKDTQFYFDIRYTF